MRRRTLLADEWKTPCKRIHEVWQPVRMWCRVELPDVEDIALVLQDSGLVVVDIEIVGCGEEGHYGREASCPCLTVHAVSVGDEQSEYPSRRDRQHGIPGILGFMSADD